jgi:cell division protein FtsW (lipid II flippase)
MGQPVRWFNDARAIGLACATGATLLGLAYLTAAGAPVHYLVINAVALILGLVAFPGISKAGSEGASWFGPLMLVLGVALLGTALFGISADGASRWIRLGPLAIQVSLVILPSMLVAFACRRDLVASAGMALAVIALALQPDRAMAGVLAASLACLAVLRPERGVNLLLVLALAGFGVTLVRPDTPPAVPFVDQILYSAFDVHPLAGAAVLTGALLLVVPAIVGWVRDRESRLSYAAFGAVWAGVVVAAALGNFPTPVVGYGGSAILGYVLSLAFLPRPVRAAAEQQGTAPVQQRTAEESDIRMAAALT